MNTCPECDADMDGSNFYKGTCIRCYDRSYSESYRQKYPNAIKARNTVWTAVWQGNLPNLRWEDVPCVDCNKRAQHWDHRDYLKPLEVDPVCASCNKKRGPGLNREAA